MKRIVQIDERRRNEKPGYDEGKRGNNEKMNDFLRKDKENLRIISDLTGKIA